MDYKELTKDTYQERLADLLKRREDSGNEGQHIYADPKGIPTVGIGYALIYESHQIAIECGFSDQSHMNRVFKRIAGFTPNILRT